MLWPRLEIGGGGGVCVCMWMRESVRYSPRRTKRGVRGERRWRHGQRIGCEHWMTSSHRHRSPLLRHRCSRSPGSRPLAAHTAQHTHTQTHSLQPICPHSHLSTVTAAGKARDMCMEVRDLCDKESEREPEVSKDIPNHHSWALRAEHSL